MNHFEADTIAAIATAGGAGGIAIVRVSGGEGEALMGRAHVPAEKLRCFASHRLL